VRSWERTADAFAELGATVRDGLRFGLGANVKRKQSTLYKVRKALGYTYP
jgi:hypothetical protein